MICPPRPDARLNRMLRCAIAVSLALASLGASAQSAAAGSTLESAAPRTWDIPAGPLADTLARIARDSGQRLSADPALVAGRTAAPVRGKFSPADAARQALAGTGLELLVTEGGTLSLRLAPVRTRDGEATLAPMLVTAAQAGEGSVDRGYVSKKISPVGPWEGRSLLDTPQFHFRQARVQSQTDHGPLPARRRRAEDGAEHIVLLKSITQMNRVGLSPGLQGDDLLVPNSGSANPRCTSSPQTFPSRSLTPGRS